MAGMPLMETFISSVMKVRQLKDLLHAKRFHVDLCNHGLEAHDIVGNYLVPMFVDCGNMLDAQRAFRKLAFQNVHSWTSLISGYSSCGESSLAFDLYMKMQQAFVIPNSHTLVPLLKDCSLEKDIERGYGIHIDIANKGVEVDVFLGSTLVDMYSKVGFLADAHSVFDNLSMRDVVIWNALIAGYSEYGPCQEALNCFERMKDEEISPSTVTYSSCLKACSNMGESKEGQILHTEITLKALETDLVVGNTLINMYSKLGLLVEAQKAFDSLVTHDRISWNALIAGYAEHGPFKAAIKCYELMHSEGIFPDEITILSYLKACGSLGAVDICQQVDREISQKGYGRGLSVGNTLLGMYAKCGSLSQAQDVFDSMEAKDLVTWNALMTGYAEHRYDIEALECFDLMKEGVVCQDAITYVCALKACGNIGGIHKGCVIHQETSCKGLELDLTVGSSLVEMYTKCGCLTEAHMVFDGLLTRDVMCWNALISGYAEHGTDQQVLQCFVQMQKEEISPDCVTFSCSLKGYGSMGATDKGRELYSSSTKQGFERDKYIGSALVDMYASSGSMLDAQAVFDMLSDRDDALWNALISGYVEHGPCRKALECYNKMREDGLLPKAVTFICILRACGMLGYVDKGQEIHIETTLKGMLNEAYLGNVLIYMYSKCSMLLEAKSVFQMLPIRDTTSWNALIKGYAMNHEGSMAVECFENMREHGIRPDMITFSCLLTACAHGNLVVEGQDIFGMMTADYGLTPYIEHFNCMVDLLARTGCLDEAEKFLKSMPSSPSKTVWTVLLSGCKIHHKDSQLGYKCFDQLGELHQRIDVSMKSIKMDDSSQNDVLLIEELVKQHLVQPIC